MKVDFNRDEFGEIWLMNVDNLFVRKSRHVPSDNGTQLADYVLLQMEQLKKHEEKKRLEKERQSVADHLDQESDLNSTTLMADL